MSQASTPLVSVIIPTYNRCRLVAQAVESVLTQTVRDLELIVVDDGSSDATEATLKVLSDSRLTYLRQDNLGVSAARNRGIRASRSPWLAFLDSDDTWRPRKLELQIEALESQPEYEAVYTDEIWIRRGKRVNPRKIHQKFSGYIYNRCLPLCIISPSSILLHRRLLQEVGVFDEAFPVCEDYELWLRLSARFPLLFIKELLITKRGGHPDQLSRSTWGFDRFRLQALIKVFESGSLSFQQRSWTAAEIARKARIVAGGAARRGKKERAERYFKLARDWEIEQ